MRYAIVHNTTYEYEAPVLQGHYIVHLGPRTTSTQKVTAHSFEIEPKPGRIRQRRDYFGNEAHHFELWSPHERLVVVSRSELEVSAPEVLSPGPSPSWDDVALRLSSDPELVSVREFCFDSPLVRSHPSLLAYARTSFVPGRGLEEAARELMHRVSERVTPSTAVMSRMKWASTCPR